MRLATSSRAGIATLSITDIDQTRLKVERNATLPCCAATPHMDRMDQTQRSTEEDDLPLGATASIVQTGCPQCASCPCGEVHRLRAREQYLISELNKRDSMIDFLEMELSLANTRS